MEALIESFRLSPDEGSGRVERNVEENTALVGDEVTVRAINPDNHQDAQKLIDLFVQNFGVNHPLSCVYEPSFWLGSPDEFEEEQAYFPLTSIIAEESGRFIAHLALRKDLHTPGRVEILLPAVHPAFRKHMFKLTRVLWSVISKLATKQNWRVAYHFSSVLNPACQLMSVKCFHSTEVALISTCRDILQHEHDQICKPERRASALLFYNVFQPETIPPLAVFPPAHHLKNIQEAYTSLKIKRSFAGESRAIQVIHTRGGKISAPDFEAERFFHGLNISEVPGDLLREPRRISSFLVELDRFSEGKSVLALPLDNPACPALCEEVEAHGYRYVGIMPLVGERDFILYAEYCPDTVRELAVYSRQAKQLRNYLADYPGLVDLH